MSPANPAPDRSTLQNTVSGDGAPGGSRLLPTPLGTKSDWVSLVLQLVGSSRENFLKQLDQRTCDFTRRTWLQTDIHCLYRYSLCAVNFLLLCVHFLCRLLSSFGSYGWRELKLAVKGTGLDG